MNQKFNKLKILLGFFLFLAIHQHSFGQKEIKLMTWSGFDYNFSQTEDIDEKKTVIRHVKPDLLISYSFRDTIEYRVYKNQIIKPVLPDHTAYINFANHWQGGFLHTPGIFYDSSKVNLVSHLTWMQDSFDNLIASRTEFEIIGDTGTYPLVIYSPNIRYWIGSCVACYNRRRYMMEIFDFMAKDEETRNVLFAGPLGFSSIGGHDWHYARVQMKHTIFDPLNAPDNIADSSSLISYYDFQTKVDQNKGWNGLWARVNYILPSKKMWDGVDGVRYKHGSYEIVGNDGARVFHGNFTDGFPNLSVPDSVANALEIAGISLPLTATFMVEAGINPLSKEILSQMTIKNPSKGSLEIKSSEVLPEGSGVKIMDMYGRLRMNISLRATDEWQAYELNTLEDGIYFLSFYSADHEINQTRRLVLNR